MVVLPSWAGVAFPLLLSPCGRCGFGWSHVHILLQGGAALPSSSCCCDIFLRLLWVVRRSPLTFFRGAAGLLRFQAVLLPLPPLGGVAFLHVLLAVLLWVAYLCQTFWCGAAFPSWAVFFPSSPFFTSFRVVRRGCLFFWVVLPSSFSLVGGGAFSFSLVGGGAFPTFFCVVLLLPRGFCFSLFFLVKGRGVGITYNLQFIT